jgi:hypothetical protein
MFFLLSPAPAVVGYGGGGYGRRTTARLPPPPPHFAHHKQKAFFGKNAFCFSNLKLDACCEVRGKSVLSKKAEAFFACETKGACFYSIVPHSHPLTKSLCLYTRAPDAII